MEGTKLPFPFLFLTVICTNGWHCGLTTTSTLTTCQQHLAPTTPVRLMSLPSLSVSLSVCLSVCLVTNMITVICTNGWHRGLTGTSTLTTCQQLLALTTAPVRLRSLPSLCPSVCLSVLWLYMYKCMCCLCGVGYPACVGGAYYGYLSEYDQHHSQDHNDSRY